MAFSHSFAGEHVEDRSDEKADAHRNHHEIEHVITSAGVLQTLEIFVRRHYDEPVLAGDRWGAEPFARIKCTFENQDSRGIDVPFHKNSIKAPRFFTAGGHQVELNCRFTGRAKETDPGKSLAFGVAAGLPTVRYAPE
jgi:hypothetical protein